MSTSSLCVSVSPVWLSNITSRLSVLKYCLFLLFMSHSPLSPFFPGFPHKFIATLQKSLSLFDVYPIGPSFIFFLHIFPSHSVPREGPVCLICVRHKSKGSNTHTRERERERERRPRQRTKVNITTQHSTSSPKRSFSFFFFFSHLSLAFFLSIFLSTLVLPFLSHRCLSL